MTVEEETALRDEQEGPEKEDQELEKAETEFNKQKEEETPIKKADDTPLVKDILIALGFIRYDNKEKGIAYKLHVGPLQIGRTYNEKYPAGNMWVRCLKDCEYGKAGDFPKRDECKKIPLVALFYKIRDGELPIPKSTITGKVVGKSEKAIQIQFEEFGQTETEWWGFGALKKNEKRVTYVPASFSKETEHYSPKMQVPRDILLKDYEAELKVAEMTTSTGNSEHREEAEAQRIREKQGRAPAATTIPVPAAGINQPELPPPEQKLPPRAAKPTEYTESILKHIGILAEVTERVFAEDRIPSRQKGYSIKYIFGEVEAEPKNGKGGNHEE